VLTEYPAKRRFQATGFPFSSMHDRWVQTNPRKIDRPAIIRTPLDAAW